VFGESRGIPSSLRCRGLHLGGGLPEDCS